MEVSKRGKNWAGVKVGHVTVLRCNGQDKHFVYTWECVCDCGQVCTKTSAVLKRGVEYCGHACPIKGEKSRKHGQSYTREYRAWISMKARCYTPSHKNHAEYAGRGITVHPAWVDNFEAFLADVGKAPSDKHTIDRIDVNGNYEPDNVRWATQAEQNLNRRNTLRAEVRGELIPLKTIADKYGVSYHAVLARFKRGLTGEELVTRQRIGRPPSNK